MKINGDNGSKTGTCLKLDIISILNCLIAVQALLSEAMLILGVMD